MWPIVRFILVAAAFLFALCVLIGVALGTLTPHLIPLAVLFLAFVLLVDGGLPFSGGPAAKA